MTALYPFSTQAIRRFLLIGLSILMIAFCSLNLFGAAAKKESFSFLTGLSLDGILLSDQVELAPIFKSCDPLSLVFTEMPGCSYLEISLTTVDPITGIPIYGPAYLDFNIIYPTGDGEISLKCLTDFVECRLFEPYLGQTFQISTSLAGEDCVSVPWQEGYFRVSGAPTTSSIQLKLASGSGDVFEEVTEVENASPIGNGGGSVLFSSNHGELDSAQVTIQEVDCLTGENVAIPLVDQASYELFSSGLFDEHPRWAFNLNNIEINGAQGYFFNNPEEVNGHCYRLEIILSNLCGAAIDSSFFIFDENLFLTGELNDQNRTPAFSNREYTTVQAPTKAQIIPQPAQQQAYLKLDHPYAGVFTLSLFSTNGKMLIHYSEQMTEGECAIPVNNLPSGLYYYQLELPDQLPISGKLLRQ